LRITTPHGKTLERAWRRVAPGLFEARLPNAAPGLYHFTSGNLARTFPVGVADVPEFRRLLSTADILRPLAQATGGGVRWIASDEGTTVRLPGLVKVTAGDAMAGRGWLGVARRNAARTLSVRHYPLFAGLAVLAALLLLLGAVWRLESR